MNSETLPPSAYIGLVPSKTTGIVLPPNSHMTLAYVDQSDWDIMESETEESLVILAHMRPVEVSGFARFRLEKGDALVALMQLGSVLTGYRINLVRRLIQNGVIPQRVDSWVPHITLDYVDHDKEVIAPSLTGTVDFDTIRLKEKGGQGRVREWNLDAIRIKPA